MENKPFIVKLSKNLLFPSNPLNDEKILYSKSKFSYYNYYSLSEIDEMIYVLNSIFFIAF